VCEALDDVHNYTARIIQQTDIEQVRTNGKDPNVDQKEPQTFARWNDPS
jgi:hypothetical protein